MKIRMKQKLQNFVVISFLRMNQKQEGEQSHTDVEEELGVEHFEDVNQGRINELVVHGGWVVELSQHRCLLSVKHK